ncbi:MAG: hypothetical protein N4A33_02730 [Bacteriovoracaceae bacterium]|jgi:predicted outer membrane repeat protein|nr:hypothetical protein [Bacteriovoracaceae bacterium]
MIKYSFFTIAIFLTLYSKESIAVTCFVFPGFNKIQSAISTGCTNLNLATGTYYENGNIIIPPGFAVNIHGKNSIIFPSATKIKRGISGTTHQPSIFINEGSLNVFNLTFDDTYYHPTTGVITPPPVIAQDGGFINNSLSSSQLLLNSVEVLRSYAQRGGAIFNKGQATIVKSSLIENDADVSGGAIYNEGALLIKENFFKENKSSQEGGSIFSSQDFISQKNEFNNNKSVKGGAIYALEYLNNEVSEDLFKSNSASYGGAIFLEPSLTHCNYRDFSIQKSHFDSNSAYQGGAIFITNCPDNSNIPSTSQADSPHYFIHESIFIENDATGKFFVTNIDGEPHTIKIDALGGAIMATGDYVIESSLNQYLENTAQNTMVDKVAGGAIYTNMNQTNFFHRYEKLSHNNDLFKKNKTITTNYNSSNGGGAIYARTVETIIHSTQFEENFAKGFGGAIYSQGLSKSSPENPSPIISNFQLVDSSCIENKALITSGDGEGGCLYAQGNGLTESPLHIMITNSILEKNAADTSGGGISLRRADLINITNTNIIDNTADIHGGGIYSYSHPSSVYLTDSKLVKNQSQNYGGAAYFKNNDFLKIVHSNIEDNESGLDLFSSQKSGGGFKIEETHSLIEKSSFINNKSHFSGGAIDQEGDNYLIIEDSSFLDNFADDHGGALYLNGAATFSGVSSSLKNLTFYNNSTGSSALYLSGASISTIGTTSISMYNSILESSGLKATCAISSGSTLTIDTNTINLEYPNNCIGSTTISSSVFSITTKQTDGITYYMEFTPSSFADNGGDNLTCTIQDQTFNSRATYCDLGAWEN